MRSFTFDDVIYRADWPQQSSIIRLSPQILQWSINDRWFYAHHRGSLLWYFLSIKTHLI